MRNAQRALMLFIAVVIALFASSAHAQQSPPALAPLQGRWVVTGGEHNGKPLDSIKGGVMTIAGNAFEIRTSTYETEGNMLRLNYVEAGGKDPRPETFRTSRKRKSPS